MLKILTMKIITTFKNIDEDLSITLTGLSVYHVHYGSNLVVTCHSYRFILLIILDMLVQKLFHYHNMRPLVTLSLTWIKIIAFVNLYMKITQETITTEKTSYPDGLKLRWNIMRNMYTAFFAVVVCVRVKK